MKTSEKAHWDGFWADSKELDDVYGTDGRILNNLEKYINLKGLRVLEIGAGTGRDTGVAADRGADATALDYSEQSLDLMSHAVGDSVTIVCGDALALPFADSSFDVVFHQGLLEHFRNPADLVAENVRVVKQGGIVLIDVPQRYHYYTVLKHILIVMGKWFAGWETEFSVGELEKLMRTNGLEIITTYGHNLSPPIWYRGMRRIGLKFGVRLPMFPKAPGVVSPLWRNLKSMMPRGVHVNTALVIGCIARKP